MNCFLGVEICQRCGEEFNVEESEALDPKKFCTPECEGDQDEEESFEDEDFED